MADGQSGESYLIPAIDWQEHFRGYDLEMLEHLLHHEPSFISYYLTQISDHRVVGTVAMDMQHARDGLIANVTRLREERRQYEQGR